MKSEKVPLKNSFSFSDAAISNKQNQRGKTPEHIVEENEEDPEQKYSDSRSDCDFDMMESMGPNQVNTLLGLTMNHNSMSEAIASMNHRNSKIGSSSSLKTSVVLSEDQNLLKQSKTSGFA